MNAPGVDERVTPHNIGERPAGELNLTHGGRTLPAKIRLASKNGLSIALMYEGILGGFVGMVPLLWDEIEQSYLALGTNERFELSRAEGNPNRCQGCGAKCEWDGSAWACPCPSGCPGPL